MKKVPKKQIIIITITSILIAGLVFIISSQKDSTTSLSNSSAPYPIPKTKLTLEEIPTNSTHLEINEVKTKNFYPNAKHINQNGDAVIIQNKSYEIIYTPQFAQFMISITDSPFETYRQEAEQHLLKELDISVEEACQLNIIITTPRFINPQEAAQQHKLSFCSQ